jgi:hypothetical protein
MPPKFVAAETIAAAVEALGATAAIPGLCDFCILKRTIVLQTEAGLAAPTRVVLSKRNAHLVTAINELMLCRPLTPAADPRGQQRFFNPFGASRQNGRGYRSWKYDSNGVADTVYQGHWGAIVKKIEHTSPREAELAEGYVGELNDFFILEGGDRPRLLDLAAWYYRAGDVADLLQAGQLSSDSLITGVRAALQLTSDEENALFS